MIVLAMELPPAELHLLLSLYCFRRLAQRSVASSWELPVALSSVDGGSLNKIVFLASDVVPKLRPYILSWHLSTSTMIITIMLLSFLQHNNGIFYSMRRQILVPKGLQLRSRHKRNNGGGKRRKWRKR